MPSDEEISSVRMGGGPVGRQTGANPEANLQAMSRSNKQIVVYDRF